MTFPFQTDPVPPGHGEPSRDMPLGERTYDVIVVLGDGVERVDSSWGDADKALEERDRVRADLKASNYHDFFVGVSDQDDPERGWLEWE